MTTTCVTVIEGTVTATDITPYSSGRLITGGYLELTLDFKITGLTGNMLFQVYRIDVFGNRAQQLFGGNYSPTDAGTWINLDIGSSWGYISNFTFGNLVEIVATITGGTMSGSLCLQGKG